MKPLTFYKSSLFFIGGAALFFLTERFLLPYLYNEGVNKALLFLVLAVPHIIFFSVAIIGYKKEGNNCNWKEFTTRFRYQPIKGKMWWLAIAVVLIDVLLYIGVYELAFPFIKYVHDAFPPPAIMKEIMNNGTTFAGYVIQGNWWLVPLYLFFYLFNIFGEEFLWRGYLFPKQELIHGSKTWIVHGLLWTLFHVFAPYNALLVLPGALFMSYVVQKTQNNTLFLLSHATLNGIPLVMLIMAIIG